MQATNDDLILMAIRKAQLARMLTMTEEAIDQYLRAFTGTDAEKVDLAFTALFIREDARAMPSPRAVLDEVNKQAAASRKVLSEPNLSEADIKFGALHGPIAGAYFSGEITRGEYTSAVVALAKRCGCTPAQVSTIERESAEHGWTGSGARFGGKRENVPAIGGGRA